jgi:hypothetical protein
MKLNFWVFSLLENNFPVGDVVSYKLDCPFQWVYKENQKTLIMFLRRDTTIIVPALF